MKKKSDTSVSFGIPGAASLMVVFCVLCMSVFSILILSTCLADRRRAESSAELVDRYYEADSKAETIIAEMRSNGITGYQEFFLPVSETITLQVSVNIGETVDVITWKTVSNTDWEADNTMQVIESR